MPTPPAHRHFYLWFLLILVYKECNRMSSERFGSYGYVKVEMGLNCWNIPGHYGQAL